MQNRSGLAEIRYTLGRDCASVGAMPHALITTASALTTLGALATLSLRGSAANLVIGMPGEAVGAEQGWGYSIRLH